MIPNEDEFLSYDNIKLEMIYKYPKQSVENLRSYYLDNKMYNNYVCLLDMTEKNKEKIFEYLTIDANKGNINAINNIGTFHMQNEEYDKAKAFFLIGAEKGNIDSLCNLGFLYQKLKNYELTKMYFTRSADKGDVTAQVLLAYLYGGCFLHGHEIKFWRDALRYGIISEEDSIEYVIKNIADISLAEKYYKMAANQGHEPAMINLASIYVYKKEFKLAEKYLLIAIEKKNVKAMVDLGALYSLDLNDHENAKKYLILATENGDENAFYYLGKLYEIYLFDKKMAMMYYEKCLNFNDDAYNAYNDLKAKEKTEEEIEEEIEQEIGPEQEIDQEKPEKDFT